MKKLIFLTLAFLLPAQVFAWESTLGLGYDHRHFDSRDQLGAVSPEIKLEPTHSSGFRLGGSVLWDVSDGYKVGPEIWLSNGWMTVPRQSGYFTKTAGIIDTGDLTLQSATVAAKAQVFEGGGYRLFAKPGFLVSNLSAGFFDSVDADTGAVAGLELSGDVGSRNRIFVDLQAVFSPSTEGRGRFVVSTNLVLGLQWVFAGEPHAAVSKPVSQVNSQEPHKVLDPPKSEIPAAAGSTKTPELTAPPEAQKAPEQTKDQPKVVEVPPVIVKLNPDAQKVKATLKLGPDGKLDPASHALIQRVIETHKQKPSLIKILHKNDEASSKLAKEIEDYILKSGCEKSEVSVAPDETLQKPIKISVVSK